MYGVHTFKIESIAHGKAASVDELRVQGVHNPGLLRKVVITQASKSIQDGRAWNPNLQITGGESMFQMESSTLGPAVLNSPSKGWKTINSPRHVSVEPQGVVTSDLMLHKLDEVSKSVRKLEFFLLRKTKSSCLPPVFKMSEKFSFPELHLSIYLMFHLVAATACFFVVHKEIRIV